MISSAMPSLRRAAMASPARTSIATQRCLSMACAQSVQRLNDILEEYRARE